MEMRCYFGFPFLVDKYVGFCDHEEAIFAEFCVPLYPRRIFLRPCLGLSIPSSRLLESVGVLESMSSCITLNVVYKTIGSKWDPFLLN